MKCYFKNLILSLGLLFFLLVQATPVAFSQSNVTVDDVGGLTDIRTTNTAGGPSGEVAPVSTASGPTQAGLLKDIQNLTSNLGDIAGACTFEHASPWSWNLTLGGCTAYFLSWLIVPITGSILYLAATVFNWMVFISLDSASFLLQSGGIGLVISNTWTIFRDLANMFFIFVVIYIGISTMLDLNLVNTKKQLVRVIAIAVLINFSLVVTRIIIDASNVAAYGFYDAFPVANPLNDPSLPYPTGARNLATPFMDITSVTRIAGDFSFDTWVKESQEKTAAGKENSGTFVGAIVAILMVAIVQVVGSFVLFAAAILFLNRFMIFIILMITSPVAFICFSTPKLEGYWKKWWDALLKNAFFAPIFLALYYVAANIFIGSHDTQIFTSVRGNSTSIMSFVGMLIIQFGIAVGFMVLAITSARSLGIRGAGTIVNWGNKKRLAIQKGVPGFAAQHTIGRAASAMGNSDTMNRIAGRSTLLGGYLQRQLQSTGKAAFGGSKGGYDKRLETNIKNRENIFKNLEKDRDGNYVGGEVELLDEYGNRTGKTGSQAQQEFITKLNQKQSRPYIGLAKSPLARVFKLRGSGISPEERDELNNRVLPEISTLQQKKNSPQGLTKDEKLRLGILENRRDALNNKEVIYCRRLRERTRLNRETVRKLIKSKKSKSVEDTLKELVKKENEENNKTGGTAAPQAGQNPAPNNP